MRSTTLSILFFAAIMACKTQTTVAPEQFYFKTVTVNDQQSGGFYVNNANLTPKIEINFSAPLNTATAQSAVSLTERQSSVKVPLTVTFFKADSALRLVPQQPLKSITQYTLTVEPALESKRKTALNSSITLGLTTAIDTTDKFPRLSDDELLTLVQRQTFRYFWEFGHPISGLARERNTSGDVCTSGGTGFGIMAMVVAAERGFITRQQAVERLTKMTDFLKNKTKSYHGVFPHWINGATGETIPFSANDNGADLVETSYLIQGLLTARQYFDKNTAEETALRTTINALWNAVEWDWHTKGGEKVLYWHWSPTVEWKMNHQIRGWNECLITYFLAAASPAHSISKDVYTNGWAQNGAMKNGKTFYGVTLPLGFDLGGPLFFSHYSFLGLNPKGLKDQYADYWQQNLAHSLINYKYCLANPKNYNGYGPNCWGLTASDSNNGYAAHSPTEDLGVISPTAALSAMPYVPQESMQALRFFYYKMGDKLWKEYGFIDAFNLTNIWFASSFLAIDQGPIICMIENHRTGLLWKLFMSCPEVQTGKGKLGFE